MGFWIESMERVGDLWTELALFHQLKWSHLRVQVHFSPEITLFLMRSKKK